MKRTEEKPQYTRNSEENLVETKRQISEEILSHLQNNPSKKKFVPQDYENLKIDSKFCQEWNYGSLDSADDVFYFTEQQTKNSHDLLNDFYKKICELNPLLKGISAKTEIEKYRLLRGVGSELHYKDIKYFIEEINGSGGNGNYVSRGLNNLAHYVYDLINSSEKNYNPGLDFVLCPETAMRSILNIPYNKNNKKLK